MPSKLREKLEEEARTLKRSLNAEIVSRLEGVSGPRGEAETVLALRRAQLELAKTENNQALYMYYLAMTHGVLERVLKRAQELGVEVLSKSDEKLLPSITRYAIVANEGRPYDSGEEVKARIRAAQIDYDEALKTLVSHQNPATKEPWTLAPTRGMDADLT